MELKGQVTIFVALGVVVLILAGLAVFLLQPRTELFESDIAEAEEIHNLIEQCLEISLKDAIIKVGQNGGYVNLDDAGLDYGFSPIDSDYLSYSPNTLPYWYYSSKCETGSGYCSYSKKPPLCKTSDCLLINSYGRNSIQYQIESYVESRIAECTDLSAYDGRVDVEQSIPIVNIEIAQKQVIASLIWPHKISQLDKEVSFQDFVSSQEVNLVKAYELAELIVNEERQSGTFAKQTMSMISLYSGIEERLPPTTDVSFNLFGGERIWVKEQVASDIQNNIIPLMSLYQVKNTVNYEAIAGEDMFDTGIYKGFDLGYLNDYSMLGAKVVVPNVNPEININGGQQVIRPAKLTSPPNLIMQMLGLGITKYKTTYSISYPLIVQVSDPDAFDGEGFIFTTAFEVNINNNAPGTYAFVTETDSEMPLPAGAGITLGGRDENNFTFTVIDRYNSRPINEVLVAYTCGQEYSLGVTNTEGVLITNLPYCSVGGSLTFFNVDFGEVVIPYNHDGSVTSMTQRMYQIREKEINLFKFDTLGNPVIDGVVQGNPQRLDETDYAIIILEPLVGEWPPTQVITFGKGTGLSKSLQSQILTAEEEYGIELDDANFTNTNYTIKVIPGDYAVEIILLHEVPFTLQADVVCPSSGFFTKIVSSLVLDDGGCKPLPQQTFDVFPKGGGIARINFQPDWVYEENKFIFTAQQINVPRNWDDIKNDDNKPYLGVWSEEKQINELVTFTME